jgi:glycine/D-amino acid oxidase-like deaminating enzyme
MLPVMPDVPHKASLATSLPTADQTPMPVVYANAAPSPLRAPPLKERVQTDVAIVGAGFTGLSTALNLTRKGVSVAVLETKEVGWGGSGRAFGQVVPYAKHHEDHIFQTYGPEYGARLISLLATGPDVVFGFIDEHKVACEPIRTGLLFAAHTKVAADKLETRAKFWQTRAAPVEILEADALERVVGSRYYPLALLDKRGGCVNPLGYARGLAKAAVEQKVKLFEQSRATGIKRQGNRWMVKTESGEVLADSVVLATDGYTDDLWPGLRNSIIPIRAYHVVSSPLSENLRRSILPGGQSLTDSRRLYSGIRVRADGRLHMSVDGPPFSNDATAFARRGSVRARALFPQLGELAWAEEVAGWVGVSNDQYPHVHQLDKGVFAVVGLSGRGIAFGTLLGVELTRRVMGAPEQDCALPLSPLRPMPGFMFTKPLVSALINLYRVLDAFELRQGYVKPVA